MLFVSKKNLILIFQKLFFQIIQNSMIINNAFNVYFKKLITFLIYLGLGFSLFKSILLINYE